jgi:hypothetical protein
MISSQLFASLLAGAASALILYILFRKHAISIFASISIACIPICWFGSFLYPISSNSMMLIIQAVIIAIIASISFTAYFKTLKWTANQNDHYKIVILLALTTVINFAAIGFEKPAKKPSFIQEFITWFKPVALNKDNAGFKIDIQCKTQAECKRELAAMQKAMEKAQ